MSRKGKLPPLKASNLVLRSIATQSSGIAIIATETPIERWDEQRQMVVKEVLLMDGCVFRGGRDQVPIVDSHDDSTVRNVLGSIQRMQIDGGQLFGKPAWASTEDAQETATKVNEGHLTDFSITALPIESVFVARGQTYDWSRGSVEGPAIVHVKWEPHNASICTTGADVNSVVRRSYTDLKRKVTRMDEALLGQLSAMGLPEGMTDPNQVLAWVVGKLTPMAEPGEVVENMEAPPAPSVEEPKPVENMMKPEEVARQAEAAIKRALEADKVRRKEIQSACTLAKVERAFADELCDSGVTVEVANKRIIERMATQPLGTSVGADVRVTDSSRDKTFAAMRDGLITRSLASTTLRNRKLEKPAEGHHDFVNLPVRRMAAMIVREELGLTYQHIERMSELEIMRLAMGNPQALRRYRNIIMRDAYHTTGSFGNLLLDAINKTLLSAYEEAEYTYTLWARQGASTPDLKAIHRMRFSEFPNLEMIPESDSYPQKKMTDSKESYSPDKYGAALTFSWESFINDDLDAFSKGPVMMGNAAKRTINQKVYEVLTANATMGDGKTLFATDHESGSNTSGSAAAPSVTTLNAGFLSMRSQKGLNSTVAINVTPRYLIHSPYYEATVDELLTSTSYNAANNNEGVNNLYGPNGPQKRRLIPVCDVALGVTSTDWFLAADQAQGVDTVEYTFLQGEESPQIDQEEDFDTDTYKFKIRQTFGVKAIDWRGLYRNKA